jgi:hypothetical protein
MSVQDRLAFARAVPSTTWAGIGMSSDSTQACIRLSALLPDEPSDHLLLEKIELEFSRLVGERVE